MELNLQQLKDITLGADRVTQENEGFVFHRFTREQEELYETYRSPDLCLKAFSTSGVRLAFRTDSETLSLRGAVSPGSSRQYFAFDLFVNGSKQDVLDNFSGVKLPDNYATAALPLGEFSKEFHLGAGEKEVCLYFPWSVKATVSALTVDDGACVTPVKPQKTLLCFGDSITQGYDALYPSHKYVSRLADMLGAQEYNKAIGGEIFFPALAAARERFEPDYITVAYGTNDWNRCTKEEFIENCKAFFCNLHRNYPNAKIFVITPIWRKDMDEDRPCGTFASIAEMIQRQAGAYDNISVIQGFPFVPQDENLFADFRLHPNDRGFDYYFENLAKQIKARL